MNSILSVVATGILYFIAVIDYAILFRVILAWFISPFSSFMKLLILITEPFIAPVRAMLSRLFGENNMIDFSPMVTMILLSVFRTLLLNLIY